MAALEIHPRYRELLARLGLRTAGDFLGLQGVVCGGHPDRHVVRLTLGQGADAVLVLLKREHRTRWRDRLIHWWEGCGFVSKSRREFDVLRMLEQTDIGAPEAMAVGEADGRAFLLVRELEGHEDLRQFLRDTTPQKRREAAMALGVALARLHDAGFEHPDLYSKHVLVDRALGPPTVRFVDWQRTRRRQVSWAARRRGLAALDATLADELATPRERLRCLRTYLRASAVRQPLAAAARAIGQEAQRLLRRRRIREMRQPALALGAQNLVWLNGEALLTTRESRAELGDWLEKGTQLFFGQKKELRPLFREIALPGARSGHLVTRWASRPWRWLWACLRRQPLVAPELESMKVLFRLQRYGVVLPRLLAAGQKPTKPWECESFLLTEPLRDAVPLPTFLASAPRFARRQVLREVGRAVRQIHLATCYLERDQPDAISRLLAVGGPVASPTVALTTVHGLEKSHHANPARAQSDLAALTELLLPVCSRTDLLRGLLAYAGKRRLTPPLKHFARRVLRRLEVGQPLRRAA
jgi:hypothetical protein